MNTHTKTTQVKTIPTNHLTLREFTTDKKTVHEIYAFTRDPRVAKFVGWFRHTSIRETYKLVRKVKNRFYKYGDWNHWLIEHTESGRVIGFIHLYEEFPGLTYELSYALSAEYAGKGLMSEAVKAVVKHAFEDLHYNRISARTDKENFASEAILRKVGAEIESEVIEYYIEPNLKLIRDIHYWRLLSKKYFATKNQNKGGAL